MLSALRLRATFFCTHLFLSISFFLFFFLFSFSSFSYQSHTTSIPSNSMERYIEIIPRRRNNVIEEANGLDKRYFFDLRLARFSPESWATLDSAGTCFQPFVLPTIARNAIEQPPFVPTEESHFCRIFAVSSKQTLRT